MNFDNRTGVKMIKDGVMKKEVAWAITIAATLFALMSGVFAVGWNVRGQTAAIQNLESKTVELKEQQNEIKKESKDQSIKIWDRFEVDRSERINNTNAIFIVSRDIQEVLKEVERYTAENKEQHACIQNTVDIILAKLPK